jgi:hypothetical protein
MGMVEEITGRCRKRDWWQKMVAADYHVVSIQNGNITNDMKQECQLDTGLRTEFG